MNDVTCLDLGLEFLAVQRLMNLLRMTLYPLLEPLHSLAEPLVEGVTGGEAEGFPGRGYVRKRITHISWPGGFVCRPLGYAGDLREAGGEFIEADAAAPGDVENAGCTTFHRQDVCLDDVRNKDKVAGLLPVTVDDRGLPVEQPGDELRDHRGVLGVRILPGAEDVEVAEEDRPDTIEVGKDLPVVLAREF